MKATPAARSEAPFEIECGAESCEVQVDGRAIRLTNLDKIFFPELGKAKRDLLLYYGAVAPILVPHLRERAMVMKRYPNGIHGESFFMKRTPEHRPDWLETCSIEHRSGNVIAFPIANDLASLLWILNLGCIDLNPWYSRCDDVNRPDVLNFDLDPVAPAGFEQVRETALILKRYLDARKVTSYPKTTGSRGLHIYVPIERGPLQKQVWTVAKRIAFELAKECPEAITSEYRIEKRPAGRVLVDYNQNAWGRTLASVYSVRPKPLATVSTPVSWDEIENGIELEQFTMDNVPARIAHLGDLFAPVATGTKRCRLEQLA